MSEKINVVGHRQSVTAEEVSQVLTVTAMTYDKEHLQPERLLPVNRLAVTKAFLDLLAALGENRDHYMDALPAEWDVTFR